MIPLLEFSPNKRQLLAFHPHKILRSEARIVTDFDNELIQKKLILMNGTMKLFNGVGIAANQCFLPDSIFVAQLSTGLIRAFNPQLVAGFGKTMSQEGCLSLPDFSDLIPRYQNVKIQWQDEKGEWQEGVFEDRDACIIQHEMDHLNGKLCCDHLSKLKQDICKRHCAKIKRKYNLV